MAGPPLGCTVCILSGAVAENFNSRWTSWVETLLRLSGPWAHATYLCSNGTAGDPAAAIEIISATTTPSSPSAYSVKITQTAHLWMQNTKVLSPLFFSTVWRIFLLVLGPGKFEWKLLRNVQTIITLPFICVCVNRLKLNCEWTEKEENLVKAKCSI